MKTLIAGNWKMNGTLDACVALAVGVLDGVEKNSSLLDKVEFLVCPPFVALSTVEKYLTERPGLVHVGAQNCSAYTSGAYTGDVSAEMVKDCGASYVIIGHSERREVFCESDDVLVKKTAQALASGLKVVYCVGETNAQREAGSENAVVGSQLSAVLSAGLSLNANNFVVAYEPVWAIGTGKVATVSDIEAMHAFIRGQLKENLADFDQIRILYGGSVKPENAKEILAVSNVNGALIGGASLKANDFVEIACSVS